MYSLTVILSIFSVCCCMVNAQQNVCTTTSGDRGRCISINDCQPFFRLLSDKNRSQYDVDNLRKSHCGFDGNTPKVCCPEQNEPTPTAKPTCFTPEGNPGECISLLSCQALSNLMKPPVSTQTIQYLQKLKCNGPEQHSVCCAVPTLQPVQRSSCASTVSAYPPDPSTKCCGNDDRVGNKIYGGGPTAVDQYPWLTLIEYKKEKVVKTRCGGALISGKYVLTAGHCVIGKILESGKPTNVRLGEYNTSNEGPDCTKVEANGTDCTEGAIRIPIERLIPHPEYNPLNSQKKNDIALIKMVEMAPYTDFIRPICLPTLDVALRSTPFNLTVAGWGAVSTRESSSSIKLHVTLPFVNQEQCQPAYKIPSRNVALWKGQLCAGGEQGKDSCNGDSGGPLMYKNGRIYEAIGLVSFGSQNCGTENVPGIYTNVYEYKSWIMSNITP